MIDKRAIRVTLRAAIAFALAFLMVWGGIPVAALAEMAEEAMGTSEAAATATTEGATGAKPSSSTPAATTDGGEGELGTDAASGGLAPAADAPTGTDGALGDQPEGVPSDSEAADPALATQSAGRQPSDPRVVANSDMESGQVVTWDCVWLGSYPQTEVKQGDAAYEGLQSATWVDGDATVDGVRYRRISRSDATYGDWSDDGYGSDAYRYFRYEPIKWRILKVTGGTALAVADVALDCRPYHTSQSSVTWETSTVRSWLNGTGDAPYYSSGAQSGRTAQAFVEVAFTEDQLGAVRESAIENANNTSYGTAGDATTVRVFLLSELEVHGASATAHGFVSNPDIYDEARRCRPSDYSRAMGAGVETSGSYVGNCWWWLRSPGGNAGSAAYVNYGGYVYRDGYRVDISYAVRPALNLNLSSTHLTWAGTVSSDGTMDESRPVTSVEVTETGLTYDGTGKTPAVTVWSNGVPVPEADYDLTYASNTAAGTATVTAVGRGGYEGEATATFQIARRPVTVTADDKTKAYGEDDPELTARAEGLLDGDTLSYTLSRESGEGLGEHAITPSGDAVQGNYAVTYAPGKLTIKSNISAAEVDPIAPRSYTGSAVEPKPVVRMGEATLAEGTDYDLSYENNVNPGTATVTIAGRGDYAGTKTAEFSIGEPTKSSGASSPRVEPKSGTSSGQVATWDCVWLGSYPQTEIWQGDAAYEGLQSATWADGDATVDGVRYRRISKSDATSLANWPADAGDHRYFRYEPIKWRVLKVNGGTALAVADVALDCRQYYHTNLESVTWEKSDVRSWLNGTGVAPYYADGAQPGRTAQAFAEIAFTTEQLGAVRQSTIENADNTEYSIDGGNATVDRVFLLSESEVHGNQATAHGFVSDPETDDEARCCKATDYAIAMGASVYAHASYLGNCYWWLRSPGHSVIRAVDVVHTGKADRYGANVSDKKAVRPALNLDLSSPRLTWAGTVSSDGTVDESRPITSVEVTEADLTYDGTQKTPAVTVWSNGVPVPEDGYELTYEGNVAAGTATVRAVGKDGYEGEATATFQIAPRPVTVTADDKTKAFGEADPELTAKAEGLLDGDTVSYTLSRESGENAGEYAITPSGDAEQGNYAVAYELGKLTIARVDVSAAEVAPVASQPYTGRGVTPEPTVTLRGRTLAKGADYDLTYENNVAAGTATVTVTGKGNYTGTKTASFKIVAKTFPDVAADAWYANVVSRAAGLGLIGGYSDGSGRFGPNDKITRGQVAVILWNMAKRPAAGTGAKTFRDVDPKAYYYNAVRWASSAGVVSGYADGRFGPDDDVTREQLAVMLANYSAKVAGKPASGSATDFASMADRGKVSGWAVPAVGWCFKSKILSGSNGKVNPQGNATRAEAAKMVVGLHDLL